MELKDLGFDSWFQKQNGITPLILLSKSDLLPTDQVQEKADGARRLTKNLEVLAFSSKDKSGLDELTEKLLPGKTFCLLNQPEGKHAL